jgi:hypothetical protein
MTSNQPPQPRPKYCIICVDDDHIGLGLRAALLEDAGYSVTVVSCPFRALEYDVSQFHLAILDFDMPALNGFQLLLRLRTARASFPIVLLSGMGWELPNDMRLRGPASPHARMSRACRRRSSASTSATRCAMKASPSIGF